MYFETTYYSPVVIPETCRLAGPPNPRSTPRPRDAVLRQCITIYSSGTKAGDKSEIHKKHQARYFPTEQKKEHRCHKYH